MKHIILLLLLLYFFFLTFPLVAQETGVLYFTKVNGKFGWFENSNNIKDWKYEGEIKNGKILKLSKIICKPHICCPIMKM